ncbi:ribonucleotide-diphosphate reductase subunit beta [Enterobacteriaceae endosymbiont of Macroplea mutica]|uniref:class Ia ribonucleoside-diphosphate reductase subunit beta n=1 Tax=Enterobacteriaceae endosymbiont of Macroplea mutica TaxID=2675791 RepID=UPI001448A4A2|nr:class Ia ribonucleoside-diphosphate reductase subunit beta [Enterobacteriaceae endosymbiont of Macroplea mutica]QJC31403.1 ribonucleotide-diphosphate reductase subunit beta [Enterobacteriaceae endosymbiont of Macroplea mutica]
MSYTTFSNKKNNQLNEPMFFGQTVNIARYDQQKHYIFEQLIEKQLSFFWRPEEVDISYDKIHYANLPAYEKHIFISNLKYQTLLDSIQGRSPNIALLPLVSIPELETWIETWSFFETIHSRSYTYIIRNIINEPSSIFEDIITNKNIILRAQDIIKYYDELINSTYYWHMLGQGVHYINNKKIIVDLYHLKKKLYLCLMNINILEAIRFYVSFACSFAFAEQKLMEGNAKIIRLIARDEYLHLLGTQYILNIMHKGLEDKDMIDITQECQKQCYHLFLDAVKQEQEWAQYLFQDYSIIGLNKNILCQYIEYITNIRMKNIGFGTPFNISKNPIPWINSWLISDNVQMAPQEVEISSYLTGQIDATVTIKDFQNFKL